MAKSWRRSRRSNASWDKRSRDLSSTIFLISTRRCSNLNQARAASVPSAAAVPIAVILSAGDGASRMRFFVLVAALGIATASAADPGRILKPEDFAQLREVDEPNISPDGNLIAYVVKVADMEKDKRPPNLWLAKWDGSENRALTFGNKGQKHPRWSPDGKWVGFLSGREDDNENDQFWLLPVGGGEAEKLTDAKGGVDDFAWSPDSKRG